MGFQFFLIMAIVVASVSGMYTKFRLGFMGLFAISTLLYMEASNAFLSVQSVNWYNQAPQLHTIRSVTAGAIMTAVCNGIIVFVLGMNEDTKSEGQAEAGKTVETA